MKRAARLPVWALILAHGLAIATDVDVACREALDPRSSKVNGHVIHSAFETGRDLLYYAELLPPEFLRALNALGPDGHWLDAGCGEGMAILNYLGGRDIPSRYARTDEARAALAAMQDKPLDRRARATGVTYKFRTDTRASSMAAPLRPALERSGRGRWLEGRYFEDIPDLELGQADLISDVFGVMAYSVQLDEVVRKYLRLLREGGIAYVFLGKEGEGEVEGRIWIWRDGARLGLVEWLQTLPGVAARKLEYGNTGFSWGTVRALELRRTSATFVIPALELIEHKDGAPPYREFREKR